MPRFWDRKGLGNTDGDPDGPVPFEFDPGALGSENCEHFFSETRTTHPENGHGYEKDSYYSTLRILSEETKGDEELVSPTVPDQTVARREVGRAGR